MPRHGIPGVTQAHPVQYKFVDEPERKREIQTNWERFLRENPAHRPGRANRTPYDPCPIHNLAAGAPAERCLPRCLDTKLSKALRAFLDHEEPWHVEHEGVRYPILFGHPYEVFAMSCAPKLQAFLRALPDGAGDNLAFYVADDDVTWYTIPITGLFIQNRRLPAPRGWIEVTSTTVRTVP